MYTRIFALFATRISNFRSLSLRVRIKTKIKMEFVDNIEIERWLNVEAEIRMILWIFCCVVPPSQWFSSSSPAYQTHWTLRFERRDLKKRFAKRSLKIVTISFPKWCFFCFTCSVVFISVLLVLLQVCCLWKRDFSSMSNCFCKVFRGMPIIATKSIILIIMIILIVKSTLVMLNESLCAVGRKLKPKWICP